jgi:hypothetical protein
MNGHPQQRGSVFIPRFTLEIPRPLLELAKQEIFPWAEVKLSEVENASAADGRQRHTAVLFLKMLIQLRCIILQDTAEIMTYNEPRSHPLYTEPIFSSAAFGEYVAMMRTHLAHAPAADPMNASMEAALPGVMNRCDQIQACINQLGEQGRAGTLQQVTLLEQICGGVELLGGRAERHEQLARSLSAAFGAFATGAQPLQPQLVQVPVQGADPVQFGIRVSTPQPPQAGTAAWIPPAPGHGPGLGAQLQRVHHSFSHLFDEYRGSGRSTEPEASRLTEAFGR